MDLTELLVQSGVLDRPLADALTQTQHIEGGALDTLILETGILDEKTLQKYLEHAASIRNRIDPWSKPAASAVSLLRPQQAATYRIIPFQRDARTLEVLTNDPNDIRTIDEVGFITGCRIQVNVCSELRVYAHLFSAYHLPLPDRMRAILEGRPPMRPDIERLLGAMRARKQAIDNPQAVPKEQLGARGDLQLDWPEGVTPISNVPNMAGQRAMAAAGATPPAARPVQAPGAAPPGARPVQAQPAARPVQAQPAARPVQAQPVARSVQGQAAAPPAARPVQARPVSQLPPDVASQIDQLDFSQIGLDPGVPSRRRATTRHGIAPGPVAHPMTGRVTAPVQQQQAPVELPPLRPPNPPTAEIVGVPQRAPIVRAAPAPPPPAAPTPPAPPPVKAVRPMSFGQLKERLAAIKHRDEMTEPVMDHLSPFLERQVLFVTKKKNIIGWDARGPRLSDAVQTLSVGSDVPSVLEKVLHEKVPYVGSLPDSELDQYLMIRLGCDRRPEHILVVPVVVKDRSVALLYGEADSLEDRDRARVPMVQVAELMAETLIRLILEKKKDEPEAAPATPPVAAAEAPAPVPRPAAVDEVDQGWE